MQHDAAPVQPQQVVADESDSQSADSRPSRVKAKRGVFKACLQSKSLAQRPGEGAPDQASSKKQGPAKVSRQKKRDFLRELAMKVQRLELQNSQLTQTLTDRQEQIDSFKKGANFTPAGANVEAIGLSSQVEVLTSITEDPLVQVVSKHPATPDSFLDGLNMFEFLLEEACFNMNELCQGLQCIFLNFLFVMSKTW
ncbi:hypothetical protein WJX77_000306 [Trebouxia sp. C0004]